MITTRFSSHALHASRGPRAGAALAALACLAFFALTLAAAPAHAHTMGNGYLELAIDGPTATGQIDLAFRDLHDAVGLDLDRDGKVRWSEALERRAELERYVLSHLSLYAGSTAGVTASASACTLTLGTPGAIRRADGEHLAFPLTARCPADLATLTLDYRAIFEVDAQHRGIVRVTHAGASGTAGAELLHLVDQPGPVTLQLAEQGADFLGFVQQGVWHIWIGIDHICFLLALLLPAVFLRNERHSGWRPAARFSDVARDVLDVVTAFTLAHSITLVVSALGWMRLPVRFVETAIALSVALAAVNNLVRAVDARWAVAFALGLLHGFGFSNVLLDVGLPGHHLIAALLGFNVGVELGQLAIVAVFLPLAFVVRRTSSYRIAMWTASVAMCAIAIHWSIERALS